MKLILVCIIFISLFYGCRGGDRIDFGHIEEVMQSSPSEALAILDTIDREPLTEAERHHADLLSIKARDKVYATHDSDSLILDVISYYSSHKDRRLYPIALYYGGRVYSDLGDFPTALRYFQSALDVIPEDRDNFKLRAAAFSQTGRLLDNLRLHSDAIPYLEESIEIGKQSGDTFNLTYDYSLLSQVNVKAGNLSAARKYNAEAIRLAKALSEIEQADMSLELASILHHQHKTDSALMVIRGLPDKVDPLCRSYALAIAAEIYEAAAITDTAYIYAKELAMSDSPNRRTGFKIMFSPRLRGIIPRDTLLFYQPIYNLAIEKHLDTYEASEAIIQNSQYNYQLHVREKEKAEAGRNRLYLLVCIISVLATVAIISLLWLRMRNLRKIVHLQMTLDNLRDFRQNQKMESTDSALKTQLEIMRKNILHEFNSFEQTDSNSPAVKESIILSDLYSRLENLIAKNKSIPDSDSLWEELAQLVAVDSPDFRTRLNTLTYCKITDSEFRIALLIRCGITPSSMAILLNRTKSTISSRRSTLSYKIFGSENNIKMLNSIILFL
ncbi:MAG: tetratricopeptide repeat protein [Duncaniella sp.]|nr:tetratricopeptide repeat protein [Duncaniella sp.]